MNDDHMPQSLSKLYIHIVFSTKYREKTIAPQYRSELFAYIGGILNAQGCPCIIVGGVSDHVHILCCLSRTKTVSALVREIKHSSCLWFKERTQQTGFAWQLGYGVFSVNPAEVEVVRRYIANQETHHRETTFQDEYRQTLKKNDIEYDEKHVWE